MSFNREKISGMLVYVSVHEPKKALVKPGAPKKPDEWKASVVITDEDYADDLEAYAKELDTMISLKKVKRAEFENIYKVAPPEGDGKNVWVFTLRKSTELGKTGKPVPELYQPKAYEKVGNTLVDITHSKLIGNGSYGTISVDKFERTTGGASLFLKNILVTDLVEYTQSESNYKAGSEFDDDVGGVESAKAPAATKAKAAKAKPAPVADDDLDDDIPF
jgi:hypothetical protein